MKMSPMKFRKTKIFLITSATLMLAVAAIADDAGTMVPAAPAPPTAATGAPTSNRSKEIQFDDSVVEGMNKTSRDSLETVSKNEDPNRTHLYHRRADYKPELRQLSSEVGSQ